MSSPGPDTRQAWEDAEPSPPPRRAVAGKGGAGRHRAPGGHRARAGTRRTGVAGHQHRPSGARPSEQSPGTPSLVRSSGVMAIGTLASRVTGLLRTLILVPAIGQVALANSYNYANTLPNTVYNLAIGGILTSVIVPLLVKAGKRDSDRGEKYDQRLFTLVTVFLFVITLAATLAAGPIARLYDPAATGNAAHILVIFAYFFAPQIFFYGVTSLAGAILNARGHFAAPMWTPVVNNVVVICVTVAFMVIAGTHQTANTITSSEVVLLGVGTTLGIVAQTAALIPALRRVGFRWRPRFDFKRADVAEIGRMSGWMFGYVLTTQIAYLVTARVASEAGNAAQTHGVGAGFSAYSYAWLLFQLPYAVIAISVITALLPRMSANAADHRYDLVRSDFSSGVRLGSVIVAPAALVLAVLGPSLAEVLLSYGNTTVASARYLGVVFAVFSLGLMPYMLFQLLLRVFYSLHDSRTPALIGVVTMVTGVGANLLALAIFPPSQVVAALGAGFGLANLVGTAVAWRVLGRRLGGLAGRQIGRSLVRMHVAALPAAIFALAVAVVVTLALPAGRTGAFLIVVVGGTGALLCYLTAARVLHLQEVTDLTAMVRSRLRR
jgi:putative peptidoglycan lipid II flippase